jgi:hypothetical protein
MKEKFAKLIDVKSIVTILMTAVMVYLLVVNTNPAPELLSLYSTTYGAVITYFFTKKSNGNDEEDDEK